MILASKYLLTVFALCFAASCNNGKSRCGDPWTIFETEIVSPLPKSCRPFDSKITSTGGGITVWVAFDCGQEDWSKIMSDLEIKKRHTYYLKYASGKTPNDTGFEGYLDDDYKLLRDKLGRNFYIREMKDGVRVVYFYRK